jgi:hypothetical protein
MFEGIKNKDISTPRQKFDYNSFVFQTTQDYKSLKDFCSLKYGSLQKFI